MCLPTVVSEIARLSLRHMFVQSVSLFHRGDALLTGSFIRSASKLGTFTCHSLATMV